VLRMGIHDLGGAYQHTMEQSASSTFEKEPKHDALKVAETLFSRTVDPSGKTDGIRLSEKSTLLFPYFAQWFTDGFLAADQVDRRRNHSNHQIDLSQLYGYHPETTKLIRMFRGGLLKSTNGPDGEFPLPLYNKEVGDDELWNIDPQFRHRRTTYADFVDIGNQPLRVTNPKNVMGPTVKSMPLDIPAYGGQQVGHPLGIPPHFVFNELWLSSSSEQFRKHHKGWFAMGNDRANSTPAFVMMNVLMLREHNRIAKAVAGSRDTKGWDDERIFQTTRNILTVIVLKIVVEEYINHITPYHFKFFVDPEKFHRSFPWKWTNWMTVEFNLLYRWHSMIPAQLNLGDEKPKSLESLWNPALIKRIGLAPMFHHTSMQPAGEIGARNTWEWLVKMAEAPAIQMARDAQVGTYNDYRRLCGLPPKKTFDDISSNSEVVKALRSLYDQVEDVEFLPGLFSEDLRPNSALGELLGTLVGIDAFSQAMTNPLLSERVWKPETFGAYGWGLIHEEQSLAKLIEQNTPERDKSIDLFISMTRQGWKPKKAVRKKGEHRAC
jgi:prostaglandin-endoperoxide synthase 2